MNSKFIVVSIILGAALIGAAVLYRGGDTTDANQQTSPSAQKATPSADDGTKTSLPGLGLFGSEHSHISLLLFINNEQVDLSQGKYMLKDRLVHLENDDGIVVHKHATGVTVPYFLSTLNIKLIQSCLTLDTNETYCNSDSGKLSLIVNGREVKNFISYEMKQGDRVLVTYGNDDETNLKLKFNQIPNLSDEFLPPAR